MTVALATAAGGEDDLASDKLSHLRNVGNGFASLIYDILPSDGYVELMERCTSLWDSLTKIPNLPKLLVCTAYVYHFTHFFYKLLSPYFRWIVTKTFSGISLSRKPRAQWRQPLMGK